MNMLFPLWLHWLSAVQFHTSMVWKLCKMMFVAAIHGVQQIDDLKESQEVEEWMQWIVFVRFKRLFELVSRLLSRFFD